MTLIEKYKDNKDLFEFICRSYADCFCLDEIEGQIIHGYYAGYSITDLQTNKKYFVEQGIRGMYYGWFLITKDGPKDIPEPLKDDQLKRIQSLLFIKYLEGGAKFDDIPDFIKYPHRFKDVFKDEMWVKNDREIYEITSKLRNE